MAGRRQKNGVPHPEQRDETGNNLASIGNQCGQKQPDTANQRCAHRHRDLFSAADRDHDPPFDPAITGAERGGEKNRCRRFERLPHAADKG